MSLNSRSIKLGKSISQISEASAVRQRSSSPSRTRSTRSTHVRWDVGAGRTLLREARPVLPYHRLLEDLSFEFGRLSEQVLDLTREREQLRRENSALNSELNELITVGLGEARVLKGPSLEEASISTMMNSLAAAEAGSVQAPAPAAETCSEGTASPAVGQEAPPTLPMNNFKVPCERVKKCVGDPYASQDSHDCVSEPSEPEDDESEEEEEEENLTRERLEILRDQFDRLDKSATGFLSAQDCFLVVSHMQNQKYGHVKHNLKRVCRTLKTLTDGRMSEELRKLKRRESDEAKVAIDFEVFCEIMKDRPHRCTTGRSVFVEDITYLRRAFQWEANEHLTVLARQNIAARHRNSMDPKPQGFLRFWLETLPPIVICVNALIIGLATDILSPVWDLMEKTFLGFYITEFALKVWLLGICKYFHGSDGRWNCFDFACLLSGVADLTLEIYQNSLAQAEGGGTAMVQLLKVIRLVRLARIVRSFRYKIFEDLKKMVLGVFSGARVLWWSIVLLFIVVYTLGVFMRQVIGIQHREFASLPSAMFTVFRCFTDGCTAYDGTPLQERLRLELEMDGYGGLFMIGYILMFLVVTVGVFNLIMAVFIDNVVSTTVKRKQQELGAREDEMKSNIEDRLVRFTKAMTHSRVRDTRADGMAFLRASNVLITRELFNTWLTDPDMLSLLDDMDIDVATKFEIFDVCDVDKSGSLSPDELVSGLMRLRGPISKCDIIAVRLKVRYLTDLLEDIHGALCA